MAIIDLYQVLKNNRSEECNMSDLKKITKAIPNDQKNDRASKEITYLAQFLTVRERIILKDLTSREI